MDLKPIERTDRGKTRLNAALSVYRELVISEARNPEQQIIYWIEHSKESLRDEFRCFAIQNENEVIGYFQYSYFREEHLFFFEYLCVRNSGRKGLVPHPIARRIREYLTTNYDPDFTIVFDVSHIQLPSGERVSDQRRIHYFYKLGFRKIDFEYEYPTLQSYESRTSYSADLMVMLPGGRTEVTASEMRTIVRSVYFKHYLRWDRPFLDPQEFAERQRLIDELYAKQVRQIAIKHEFATSGTKSSAIIAWVARREPSVAALFSKIFTPKMHQLVFWMGFLLVTQWILGSVWLLFPFTVVLVVIDCLMNDTRESRKLLAAIISKLRLAWPQ